MAQNSVLSTLINRKMMISILGLFSLLGLVRAEEKPVETVSLATPLISGSEVTVTVADYQKGLLAL